MKRLAKTAIFAVVFVFLVGFSGAVYHFHYDIKPGMIKGFIAQMAPPPADVAATKAKTEHWAAGLSAIGSARAFQGIDVASQLAGVVSAIHIGSGQDVVQGAPLYDLDTTVERADLKANEAALKNTELTLQRQQQLISGGNTARSNLDQAQAARDQARAAVDRVKALVAQKTLVAPFAGRLGIRKLDVGQFAAAGASFITLQQLDPIYIDFPIPEQSLSDLKTGEIVNVTVDAFPGETFSGKVDLIDARVQNESRSVMVRALLPNHDKRLLPGMFADVQVVAGAPRDVVAVPRTAVSFSLYGDSVFVLTPRDEEAQPGAAKAATTSSSSKKRIFVAQRRFVRTGEVKGDQVAILEGLHPGETIVAEGQIKLQSGASVVIDPDAKLVPPAVLPKE